MKIGELLKELEKFDTEEQLFFGKLVELVGGSAAHIKKNDVGLTKIGNIVVLHIVKQENRDDENSFEILTDFD